MRGRLPSFHWFWRERAKCLSKILTVEWALSERADMMALMAVVNGLGVFWMNWGFLLVRLEVWRYLYDVAAALSPFTHSVATCGTLVLPSLELVFLFGEHHHTLMLDSRLRPLTLAPLLKLNYPLWYMPIFTQLINHLGDDSGLLYFGCIYLLL